MELDLSDFDYHDPTTTATDFKAWLQAFRRSHDKFQFDEWLTCLRLPDMSCHEVPLDLRDQLERYYEQLLDTLSGGLEESCFGISRVWKLVVKDSERYPVSDRLICKWVTKFQVVDLDWRKLDLDISRLVTQRSQLRKIKLYSGGNWPPIFFWTSSEGLVRLRKVGLPFLCH